MPQERLHPVSDEDRPAATSFLGFSWILELLAAAILLGKKLFIGEERVDQVKHDNILVCLGGAIASCNNISVIIPYQ